jgi:hypothetical protein
MSEPPATGPATEARPAVRPNSEEAEQRKGHRPLLGREHHLGDRQHLRRHHRPADPLDDAGCDQHLDIGGHAADRRGEREAADAEHEHALLADDVAIASEGQQAEREGQDIAGHHPFDAALGRAEVGAHAGQRDIDDGDVDHIHEAGQQQHGHRHPAAFMGAAFRSPGGAGSYRFVHGGNPLFCAGRRQGNSGEVKAREGMAGSAVKAVAASGRCRRRRTAPTILWRSSP